MTRGQVRAGVGCRACAPGEKGEGGEGERGGVIIPICLFTFFLDTSEGVHLSR